MSVCILFGCEEQDGCTNRRIDLIAIQDWEMFDAFGYNRFTSEDLISGCGHESRSAANSGITVDRCHDLIGVSDLESGHASGSDVASTSPTSDPRSRRAASSAYCFVRWQ